MWLGLHYFALLTNILLIFWRNPLIGAFNLVSSRVTFKNKVFDIPKGFGYFMTVLRHVIRVSAAHSEDNGANKDV